MSSDFSAFEIASLRLQAFWAMKGWGEVREGGHWKEWSRQELREQARIEVNYLIDRKIDLRCGFCLKGKDEVKKLIAGEIAMICDECVDICTNIIAEKNAAPSAPLPPSEEGLS